MILFEVKNTVFMASGYYDIDYFYINLMLLRQIYVLELRIETNVHHPCSF